MSAAGLAARGEVRRQWGSVVTLAVLVALVAGVVLAATAGARRSSTVVDRFLDATTARDLGAFAVAIGPDGAVDGAELVERIGRRVDALPGVTETGTAVGYPTGASEEFDLTVVASPDDSSHRIIDRPVVLDGRMPPLTASRDVAINDAAARLLDVDVGDVIHAPTFSPEDCAGLARGEFLGFNGPPLELRVVGRVRVGDDLRGDEATSGPIALASAPFIERHRSEVCSTVVFVAVRTTPDGPSKQDVQAIVDGETAGLEKGLVSTVEEDYARTTRSAVDSVSTVLVLVAVVAAAGGLVAVAQALRRQATAGAPTSVALGALGMSRAERALVIAAPSLIAVALGVAVGLAVAWLLSSVFPPSIARAVEPSPGRDFDSLVLLGGGALLLLGAAASAVVSSRRAGAMTSAATPRPSRAVDLAARLGWRPSTLVGLRLAYESGPAAGRVPSRSALASASIGVLGVVGVLVVVTSTDDAIAEPARYGWSWSAMPDLEVVDPTALIATLEDTGVVAAAGRLIGGAVEADGQRLQGHAIEDLFGSTSLVMADGRPPSKDDEIALGGGSLHDLDVSIGDQLRVEDADGAVRTLDIVGQAVVPIVNDSTNPGSGAVLTAPALEELTRGGTEDNLVLTYTPGTDAERAEALLTEQGLTFSGYARPQVPGRLLNLREVRGVFVALAAFLGLLGIGGLTHALAVSSRRRRLDFAVLRAIGFLPRQVRAAVRWQSIAIVLSACAFGVPLGFVAGRLSWRVVVAELHMLEGVSTPLAAAAVTVAAAVAIGALLAVLPAVVAARRRPAGLLRVE